MKRYRRDQLVPPGVEPASSTITLGLAVTGMSFYSLILFARNLNIAASTIRFGVERRAAPFIDLVSGGKLEGSGAPIYTPVFGLSFLVILAAVQTFLNYRRFRQGSQTIYLMRRLPDKWELPRRCLAFPLLTIWVYLLAIPLLTLIFYLMYRFTIPAANLPPDQWSAFWQGVPLILLRLL
ncbi:MAG: hypothetical protein PUH00_10130 [Clostridiales bacterium]|nr:hypothetical protein [Clostridiales bacterium]